MALLAAVVLASFVLPSLAQRRPLTDAYFWEAWLKGPDYFSWVSDSWQPMIMGYDHIRSGDPTPVYDKLLKGGLTRFQYPPSSLFVLSAFDAIGLPRGVWVLVLNWLNLVPLAATVAFTFLIFWDARARESSPGSAPPSRTDNVVAGAAALVLIVCFMPLVHALRLGQAQMWVNALAAAMIWCWRSGRRERVAGVLCGVVCLVKPMFGVLALWGVMRRRYTFAAAAGAVVSVGFVISVALYGVRDHLNYVSALSFLSQRCEGVAENQSFNGALHVLLGIDVGFAQTLPPYHPVIHAGTAISSAALLALLLLTRPLASRAHSDVDAALAIATSVIASPIAWGHHYALFLPLYAWLTPRLLRVAPFGRWTGPYLLLSFLMMFRDYDNLAMLDHSPFVFLRFHELAAGLMFLFALYRAEPRSGWLAGRRSVEAVAE